MKVALDIETVRNEKSTDWWDKLEVKAPSNYKDEEKIKKYVEAKRKTLGNDSALYWHTGKVFSVGLCFDSMVTEFFYSLDEAELLTKLDIATQNLIVYSKSGKSFDYPFLVGRYMANNLHIPAFLKSTSMRHDVDEFFSWSHSCQQRMTLDGYAHGLGIEGKKGDFTIVEKAYNDLIAGIEPEDSEHLKELEVYNKQDALIVMDMVIRYNR